MRSQQSELKEGPQEGLLLGRKVPLQLSVDLTSPFSSGEMFFPFLLWQVEGDGEDGALEGEEGRLVVLPLCPADSILAGKVVAECVIALSKSFFALLQPDFLSFSVTISFSSSPSLPLFNEDDLYLRLLLVLWLGLLKLLMIELLLLLLLL